MRVRVRKGELHRLELRVESRRQTVVEGKRDECGGTLAVRRQLADLDAAIVVAKRVDPFGAVAREIRLVEPRGGRDRGSHASRIESVRALPRDPLERLSEPRD